MSKRYAPRYCSECGTVLPNSLRPYAEVIGGFAVEHAEGGAHRIEDAEYSGRVLCKLHFNEQRPKRARPVVRVLCDDCGTRPVKYRQIAHAWTRLPAGNMVLDARYSALALCEECYGRRFRGEQLRLDGTDENFGKDWRLFDA